VSKTGMPPPFHGLHSARQTPQQSRVKREARGERREERGERREDVCIGFAGVMGCCKQQSSHLS
jgi:hypothetical protein